MTQAFRRIAILLGAICLVAISVPGMAQDNSGQSAKNNVETTQYNNWQVRCAKSSTAKSCRMSQLVSNPNSSTPIMRVIMAYPPNLDGAAMAFLVPLGTRLMPGLRISVGAGKPIRVPFQTCMKNGCRASLRVDNTLMSKFKQGTEFTVTINGPRGRKIDLNVSLMGFTDAESAIAE